MAVNISASVKALVMDLKEKYKLTDFEALTLALKAEENDIFRKAFVVASVGQKAIKSAIENLES
jgi:hypothetical protein